MPSQADHCAAFFKGAIAAVFCPALWRLSPGTSIPQLQLLRAITDDMVGMGVAKDFSISRVLPCQSALTTTAGWLATA